MTVPAMPARGADWEAWATALDSFARKYNNSGVYQTAGVQIWNGTSWSARPTGFLYVDAFSDGTAGSTSSTSAPAPTGAVNGDRWWKAV